MKNWSLYIFILSMILLSCSDKTNPELTQKIQGQGNRHLTYTLSPQEIWVGVPLTLTLKMKGEKNDDVILPRPESLILPEHLRLIEAKADDDNFILIVKADKPGEYAIPPLSVLFENPGENVELLTRPMEFIVQSLVEEGSENNLSGLWKAMKIGFLPLWQVLIIIMAALVVGLFLFWLLYWRKREKIVPLEPVWSLLERELSLLGKDDNLLNDDRGLFYDLTSSLIKRALDGVYHQHTGEKTREEFISALVLSTELDSEVKLWLTRFFERADLVRFAKTEVARDTALADLDEVVRFTSQAIKKAKEPPLPGEKEIPEPKVMENLS